MKRTSRKPKAAEDQWSRMAAEQRHYKQALLSDASVAVQDVHPRHLVKGDRVWYQTGAGPRVAEVVGFDDGYWGRREHIRVPGEHTVTITTLSLDPRYLGAAPGYWGGPAGLKQNARSYDVKWFIVARDEHGHVSKDAWLRKWGTPSRAKLAKLMDAARASGSKIVEAMIVPADAWQHAMDEMATKAVVARNPSHEIKKVEGWRSRSSRAWGHQKHGRVKTVRWDLLVDGRWVQSFRTKAAAKKYYEREAARGAAWHVWPDGTKAWGVP